MLKSSPRNLGQHSGLRFFGAAGIHEHDSENNKKQ